jgi:hypothetical protein
MAKKKSKATNSQFSALVLRALKQEVNQKAGDLIENVLKPRHIQPPQAGRQFRLMDMGIKWLGSRCYLVAIYRSVDPPPTYPDFESKFAKMEYVGDGKFALSFQRHTGEWVELYEVLTVDECLTAIRDDPWFVP